MAGFTNDASLRQIVFCDNVDFSGSATKSATVTADGQLLIGSTASPNIRVNTLTAGTGISIANGSGSITISGSGSVPLTFTEDAGSAVPSANNLNIFGTSAQGISTSGAGATVTITAANATTAQKGVVALATNAEAIAGTDTAKALTADDLKAKLGTQTAHSLAVFEGTSSAVTALGAATNGQLPIGSTGADPVLATLTAGTGISISNGAGSITINSTGGMGMFTWVNQTVDLNPLVKFNAYEANKGTLLTLTLPTGATFGDTIRVQGFGAGGWQLNAGTGQTIQFLQSATTVAGSLASTNRYDYVEVVCSSTTTTWFVTDAGGNLTVA